MAGAAALIAWIVVGLAAGWLAAVLLPDGFGVVSHLVVGVLGAVIGGVLVSLAVPGDGGLVGSIVVAVAGAVVLLLMLRLVSRSKILADD